MDAVIRTLVAAFETLQDTTLEPGSVKRQPGPRLSLTASSGSPWMTQCGGASLVSSRSSRSSVSNAPPPIVSSPATKRKRGDLHNIQPASVGSMAFMTDEFPSSSSDSLGNDYAVKSRRLATGLSMYFTDSLNLRGAGEELGHEEDGPSRGVSMDDCMKEGSSPGHPLGHNSRSSSLSAMLLQSSPPQPPTEPLSISSGNTWTLFDSGHRPSPVLFETRLSQSPSTDLGFSPPRQTTCHQHDFEKQQRAHQILQDLELIAQSSPSSPHHPSPLSLFPYPLTSHAFRSFIESKTALYQSDLRPESPLWSLTECRRDDIGRLIDAAFKRLVEIARGLLVGLEVGLAECNGRGDRMEPDGSLEEMMDQIHALLQTCGDLSTLFRTPFPRSQFPVMSRLAAAHLSFLLVLFDQIRGQAVVSEAKLMHLFQSGIHILKALGRVSVFHLSPTMTMTTSATTETLLSGWIPHETLERVALELGLGLCEQTGVLWDHGKRSRTMLMMHLIGRYIRALVGLGRMGVDERKRILHMTSQQFPDR